MIIPSIDIAGGRAVQLERGRELRIDAGDPRPIARAFGRVGEIAVIDLDAAKGEGSNADLIEELLTIAPCRVGGGIRDVETAVRWLDRGAAKVILGTAAREEILRELPRERVIAALDAEGDEIVTHGWRERSGELVADRIAALRAHVGGFLLTFVQDEGTMSGLDLERAARLKALAEGCGVTVAGGVREASEIGALDALAIDAQVGMALYSGRFDLADALAAMLTSDREDGLWPTVVCDEAGRALGLVYSSVGSLRAALAEGVGVYHSRRRGLWRKGETSGDTQELLRVDLDCDRDALRFTVRQAGAGFCHLGRATCFGEHAGLARLESRIAEIVRAAPPGSYTARLLTEAGLLGAKLREEAAELAEANGHGEIVHEAADLLYFAMVRLARDGVRLAEVERHLDGRALRVTRRRGDAKPPAGGGGSA